jgi:TolB-like protein/Flp pilus assembly protein TadD
VAFASPAASNEQVRDRLDELFEDLGEQEIKNIARPVRVWRWLRAAQAGAPATEAIGETETLPLPDKPSIAVLPFDNLSGDPEQEYFADGMAEDIITALSRFHEFFVIARNSSFTYKGQAVDVKQVARELGVRYVIEGSVRRAGNRVRITAQLIDAASGNHIWAERYDRDLDDIFAVQDDITERIAMAVGPELHSWELARARRKSLPELGVWEIIARANWHAWKFTEKDTGEAEALLSKALEGDPDYARIHAALSGAYSLDALYGWRRPLPESRAMSLQTALKAVELDKEDEFAQTLLGSILYLSKRHEEATQRLRTAIGLNPNYSFALGQLGIVLVYTHNHDEALELLHKAMQLSPKDLMLPFYVVMIGVHHFIEERYEDALVWADKALHENPNLPGGYRLLASAHGLLDNLTEARAAYEQLAQLAPGMTIAATIETGPLAFPDDIERFSEGLRRAGMPE